MKVSISIEKSRILILIFFFSSASIAFAQIESPGDMFFSSEKNKIPQAYFTVQIEGDPKLVNDSYLINLNLNGFIEKEKLRSCTWSISGPEVSLYFRDSIAVKTVQLSIPMPHRSGWSWNEYKKYVITLTAVTTRGGSVTMGRKLIFQAIRSGRKNFGNDFGYKISPIWLAAVK